MGRETKCLLALLGTLAFAFVGVLSTKLLIPRPPTGAGPDVHAEDSVAKPHDLVEPPALSSRRGSKVTTPTAGSRYAKKSSVFGGGQGFSSSDGEASLQATPLQATPLQAELPKSESELPKQDPFVRPAVLEQPLPAAALEAATLDAVSAVPVMPVMAGMAVGPSHATSHSIGLAAGSWHVTAVGDSWWSLAERAYGDGRLYRALFAWNRVLDPRVSLAPGTRLEIPPQSRLESAWPKLVSFGAHGGG